MIKNEIVTVQIKYQETEQIFTGDVNQVWICINKFFSEMIPALKAVKKIILTVELESLIEAVKNVIAIAPEGPVVLVDRQKLTDNQILTLHLLGTYIGNKLGFLENYLTKEELQLSVGKNAKITSTRLGELVREGLVMKTEKSNYKLTTHGIKLFQQKILPEIKEKTRL